MQLFIGLLCTITLLFSTEMASGKISEKMIVSSSKFDKIAAEDLLKLKVYFIENTATRALQEKHDLEIKMETLETYKTVTIQPIDSLELRNELLILLAPLFQDIFYIEYKKEAPSPVPEPMVSPQDVSVEVPGANKLKKEKSFLMDEVGLQWLALWILSIIGLFLSIRNRRKMALLNKKQTTLKTEQANIETEIKKLGVEDE